MEIVNLRIFSCHCHLEIIIRRYHGRRKNFKQVWEEWEIMFWDFVEILKEIDSNFRMNKKHLGNIIHFVKKLRGKCEKRLRIRKKDWCEL